MGNLHESKYDEYGRPIKKKKYNNNNFVVIFLVFFSGIVIFTFSNYDNFNFDKVFEFISEFLPFLFLPFIFFFNFKLKKKNKDGKNKFDDFIKDLKSDDEDNVQNLDSDGDYDEKKADDLIRNKKSSQVNIMNNIYNEENYDGNNINLKNRRKIDVRNKDSLKMGLIISFLVLVGIFLSAYYGDSFFNSQSFQIFFTIIIFFSFVYIIFTSAIEQEKQEKMLKNNLYKGDNKDFDEYLDSDGEYDEKKADDLIRKINK